MHFDHQLFNREVRVFLHCDKNMKGEPLVTTTGDSEAILFYVCGNLIEFQASIHQNKAFCTNQVWQSENLQINNNNHDITLENLYDLLSCLSWWV